MAKLGASFRMTGVDELSKRIRSTHEDVLIPSARAAGKAGMKIVRDVAISRAQLVDDPKTPNDISEHIAVRTGYSRPRKTMTVRVGVLGEAGTRSSARYRRGDKPKGLVTYWRFVELGTSHSRARPFLRPALANNATQVMQEVVNEMNRQLDRRV